jgi:hypothetical protein
MRRRQRVSPSEFGDGAQVERHCPRRENSILNAGSVASWDTSTKMVCASRPETPVPHPRRGGPPWGIIHERSEAPKISLTENPDMNSRDQYCQPMHSCTLGMRGIGLGPSLSSKVLAKPSQINLKSLEPAPDRNLLLPASKALRCMTMSQGKLTRVSPTR